MISEKPKSLVSIIINNYNYERFLGEAIDSALNQVYSNTEVIVVDDGSTDNSGEIISSYGNRVIPVLKQNGGQASAFNAGFAASKGEIICILDSDDVFLPEKVAKVADVLEQHQDAGWCFHPLKLVDANTNILPQSSSEDTLRECDFRLDLQEKGRLRFSHPATSGLCFTRSLLQQILPMPEAQGISIGDHYLKFMASALSKGFYLNQELTLQKVHGGNAYTHSNTKYKFKSRIFLLTAYWIQIKLPVLKKFTNKLFAVGIGTAWKAGGVETEYSKIAQTYLSSVSLLERLEINLRALYYYLKKAPI